MTNQLHNGLYAITDCKNLNTEKLLEKTGKILNAGVVALQYRDKWSENTVREHRATELQKLCRQYDVPFIVNDDLHLAHTLGADGVHLGRDDAVYDEARTVLGSKAIIGLSCYDSLDRAINAEKLGADYIAFGAFFPTQTKSNTTKATTTLLKKARTRLAIPVVAIGGITPDNAGLLVSNGANMLAVISSLYTAAEPGEVVRAFNQLFA